MLQINQIGYNFWENNRFSINRPSGSGDYLVLYFITEVDVMIEKEMQTIPPFSVIIFTPGQAQVYRNHRTGFLNDWIHFEGQEAAGLLDELALPLNKPFLCEYNNIVRRSIQGLESEFRIKEQYYRHEIDARLSRLLIKLARWQAGQAEVKPRPRMRETFELLRRVRSIVLTQYSKKWSLDEMAALASLSRSRFCSLYKEYFQTSPFQDLASERFAMARHLLETTESTIQEIASRVGYPDLCHFSKQYKKTYGISPGKARTLPEADYNPG